MVSACVCPDTDASTDQKKVRIWHFLKVLILSPSTRSPSSRMVSPLITIDHCYITVSIWFLFVFYLFFDSFSFWSLLVFGRLTVIEGDWRGLTRLDWQDLRSIIKGRKCSNEKVARADGVLSTYWNRFMKYIDYCTICTPSMPHNYIQGARVNWPTARC